MNDDGLEPEPTLRVGVLAAYPSLRAGLRAMLAAVPGLEVTGEGDWPPQPRSDGVPPFDVLVADVGDGGDGLADELSQAYGATAAVLLGAWDDGDEPPAATGAARGYLRRDASEAELVAAVRAVGAGLSVFEASLTARFLHSHGPLAPGSAGDAALTEREREVLELLALGLPNKGIALRLGISEHTAKFHVGTILSKLGAASRTEAVMVAARRGLLPL